MVEIINSHCMAQDNSDLLESKCYTYIEIFLAEIALLFCYM